VGGALARTTARIIDDVAYYYLLYRHLRAARCAAHAYTPTLINLVVMFLCLPHTTPHTTAHYCCEDDYIILGMFCILVFWYSDGMGMTGRWKIVLWYSIDICDFTHLYSTIY